MKLKYRLNNFIFLIIVMSIILLASVAVNADTQIVYDNTHKVVQVTSDVCTTLKASCMHKWYIDGFYYGSFPDNFMVPVLDGTNVTVNLDDPVNTNLENITDSQPSWIIIIMTFMQPVLPWIFIFLFAWLLIRGITKRRRRK